MMRSRSHTASARTPVAPGQLGGRWSAASSGSATSRSMPARCRGHGARRSGSRRGRPLPGSDRRHRAAGPGGV